MPDHLFPLVTTDSFVITPPTRGGCCLEHAKTPKQQFNTICMTKHWLGYPLLHGSSQLRGQGGTISKMNRTPPPSCHPHRTMVTDDLFTVSESLPGLGPMTPVMVWSCPFISPQSILLLLSEPGKESQRQLRYIEWMGVEIYDFQKVTISTLFKLYNAGLGVLIPKRYHMWG